MLATQEKTIDGMKFAVTQLPAMKSLLMLRRVMLALGPAAQALGEKIDLAKLNGAVKGLDVDIGDAAGGLLAALPKLAAALPPAELEAITNDLLETATVTIDGKTGLLMPQFDHTMQGRIPTVLKLLVFAIQVNYGNFSELVKGLAGAARPKSSSATSPSG